MSNFTYEKKGTSTYLVYTIGSSEEVDTICLGMITNNSIKGLVPTISIMLNGQRLLQYDVSSKVTAKQILSDVVTSKRLLGIFSGIADALLAAEEYMISPDSFVMDLEYMYVDVTDFHTELVCVPVQKEQEDFDLSVFFKKIMFRIRIDQNENSDYFTTLLNVLNSEGVFSLNEFKRVVDELKMETPQRVATEVQRTGPKKATVTSPQRVEMAVNQLPREPQAVKQDIRSQTPVRQVPPEKPVMGNMGIPGNIKVEKMASELVPNGEKPMSVMYLLQHYSKENAAKYKAQKEMMKNQKPISQLTPLQSEKKKSKNEKKQSQAKPAFQIPGQETASVEFSPVISSGAAASMDMHQISDVALKAQPIMEQGISVGQEALQTGHMDFGKTTMLDDAESGETVILGMDYANRATRAMLVRKKNNEQILLEKDVFKIGKQQGYVDYLIRDNATISRSHANIIKKGNQYYVVDTNSTNHVYVNGQEIACNEEVPINSGTIIRLSNEEFEFLLY